MRSLSRALIRCNQAALLLLAIGADAAWAQDPVLAPAVPVRPRVMPNFAPAAPEVVEALMADAEQALSLGDAVLAYELFERAAGYRHSADIEAGWVRAQMQAGQYRAALAFAAHVAGAHPLSATGTVLYAWLLALGGQQREAAARIRSGLSNWPDEPNIRWLHEHLYASFTVRGTPPPWLRPYATGDAAGAGGQVIGSGVLIAADLALANADAVASAGRIWVRDGLGRTRTASVRGMDARTGLATLQLARAFDASPAVPWATADAFPGSPAFFSGFEAGDATARWPLMRVGFLGAVAPGLDERRLGSELLAADGAEPVFDHAGQLAGVGLLSHSGITRFVPASMIRANPPAAKPNQARQVLPRLPPDLIYERALRATLQVIVSSQTVP